MWERERERERDRERYFEWLYHYCGQSDQMIDWLIIDPKREIEEGWFEAENNDWFNPSNFSFAEWFNRSKLVNIFDRARSFPFLFNYISHHI